MGQEPYIIKQGNEYRLKIGKNLVASPCHCTRTKGIHFHHNGQGDWNPKGKMENYIVDETKDYPNV